LNLSGSARLFDVERNRIDEMDPISESRQPRSVSPRAATNICDDGRRGRQVPLEQHLGACKLECTRSTRESVPLHAEGVVACDVWNIARRIAHELPLSLRRAQTIRGIP